MSGANGRDPHGPIRIQALGGDTWRLECRRARCPKVVTTVTSPGGVKAFLALHRAPAPAGWDALVERAQAEVRS